MTPCPYPLCRGLERGHARPHAVESATIDSAIDKEKIKWVKRLDKYGRHLVNCRVEDKRFGCTCGWEAIADQIGHLLLYVDQQDDVS